MSEEASNREALAYCDQRLEAEPADGIYWFLKGNCHYRLGELESAADSYRQAVRLGEVSCQANFFWGECLLELGRVEEAIAPLRAQLELTPDHLDALFLLGLSYHVLDDRDSSEPLLERVRDLDARFYEDMFASYAELLASGTTDPFIRQGLVDAARALRRGG